MLTPSSGLYAPLWQVAQLSFGPSFISAPCRFGGKVSASGSRYSLFRFRTMRMPYQACARVEGLVLHSPIERLLWQ